MNDAGCVRFAVALLVAAIVGCGKSPPSPPVEESAPRTEADVGAAAVEVTPPIAVTPPVAVTPPSPDPQSDELSIAPEEIMRPWTGDLDGMIDRGVIRLLTVYSKTFYFVDKATQRGVIYDIGRLFEDDLNKRLRKEGKLKRKHLKVQVFFIPVSRDELLPALVSGKGDIAWANLTITPERQALVDFSAPIMTGVREVLVSGPASPPVGSLDELAGKAVFVRKSSSYDASLVELNRRFAAEKKPPVIIREAPETLEDEDLIEMLNAGLVPLIVVDEPKADFWKKVFPDITVHDGIVLRSEGDHAPAIRKGSPQLKAALDNFVARHRQGSLAGNTILARYLKSTRHLKDAGSESERKKFFALVQYFKKYGAQYDVDWLLMVAQGYQESRLDHAVRSPVGAIGVMQVMPATGKELKVGDIRKIEPNIHAGIKYMRWMIDQYYGKEPMTELDKALFAFASYNAGAGRISQLRREAARRGLNPDVWFQNVEYVAAEKIGAETVTYVGNIYKYYIAYRLMLEARAERDEAAKQLKKEAG